MPFTDLDELLEPWLDLPIKGKTYRIASVDAATGLYCQRVFTTTAALAAGEDVSEADAAALKLDDDEERSFTQRLLGDAYQQLIDDGVPWEHLQFVTRVVYAWVTRGRAAAEELWESGGRRPEPPAPVETPASEDPQDSPAS